MHATHFSMAVADASVWPVADATHLCEGSVVHIPVTLMCTMEPLLNDVPHKSLGVL